MTATSSSSQPRRKGKPGASSGPPVRLCRNGQFIDVSPASEKLRHVFRTSLLVPSPDPGRGCALRPVAVPLFSTRQDGEEEALTIWAGMEPVVREISRQSGTVLQEREVQAPVS